MVFVLDIAPDLDAEVQAGNVRCAKHPTLPLYICNYTEQCVYARHWNETTMTCRGLVADRDTGEVVARPFRKFFNVGEPGAPELDPDQDVWVTDKHDGSLGIAFWYRDQWHMASRGSFTSEQAVRGGQIFKEHWGRAAMDMRPALTYLFEIIYPENRIVLDYGDTEELKLLAGVSLDTGWISPSYPIHMKARDALALPDRTNAEGYVIYECGPPQHMWKVKQADYLARHKIIFGLNERVVWEWLMDPDRNTFDAKAAELPDELYGWATQVALELDTEASRQVSDAEIAFEGIKYMSTDRKSFAIGAQDHPRRHLLFKLYDGASLSDIYMLALKDLKPRGDAKPKWGADA